jgi:hypothetical protein
MENLPAFPRLNGPLGRLVDSITDDIPYDFRALAALTYVGLALSGRTKFAVDYDNLQSRWFACLIGPAHSGKSAAINEVEKALSPSPFGGLNVEVRSPLGRVHILKSINSEAALSLSLAEHSRLLWLPDEASGAFDKAKSGKMFHTILRLLEHNDAGHVVRDKSRPGGVRETRVRDGHFAMLMGATPQVFTEMWTGTRGGGSGLQSRFILAYSEKKMPKVRTASDLAAVKAATDELYDVLQKPIASIDLPFQKGDFTHGLTDGVDTEDTRAVRAVEMGRRFVLMLAACNKQERIEAGDEVLRLGREFIQYQIAAFERFMPADAANEMQRFEGRIITFFERHDGPHTEREVRNNLRPENSPGGFAAFRKTFDNLTASETGDKGKYIEPFRSGELIKAGRKGLNGSILWKLNPNRNISDPSDHVTEAERSAKEFNDRLRRILERIPEGPVPAPSVQVRDPLPTVPTAPPARDPVPTPPTVEVRDPGPTVPTPVPVRDPGPTPPTVAVKDDRVTTTQVAQEERPPESLYDDLLEEQ